MQSFTQITDQNTLLESIGMLMGNDKTALSCSSGTAFPTTNLEVGMFCYRTDESKLYQLKDATPTWKLIFDLSKTATDKEYVDTGLAAKQASLGYTPVNNAGDTMTGRLNGYAVAGTTGGDSIASMEARNNGGTGDTNLAAFAFHCTGSYGIKLHLRADGYFGIGGWSRGGWSWYSSPGGDMVAAGNVTAYSDPRLKEKFERIADPFAILDAVDGGTFFWRHGFAHTECKAGKRDYGILADQVEAVMPEIVTESIRIDGESYKTVAYEKLVPVMIEALKKVRDDNESLLRRIEELESR